jgi:hypothetical protein
MLNRTNRTLSANLNRLNLGTRSLALVAGINNGEKSLHIRHAHGVIMRAGMVGYCPPRIPDSRPDLPFIPGSSSVPSWLFSSRSVRPWVEFAAAVSASAITRLVSSCDQPGGPEAQPSQRSCFQERVAKPNRKPLESKRSLCGHGLRGTTTRATQGTVTAIFAATGG